MASPIDTWSSKRKEALNEMLLAGKPMREIARLTGLSKDAICRYKHRAIVPAIKTAVRIQQSEQIIGVAPSNDTVRDVARQVVGSSPLRARLDKLWGKIDDYIAEAKLPDKAALINQAHKNLELLGRATGELSDSSATGATGLSVQMMNILMMPVKRDRSEPAKIVDAGPECSTDQSS